MRFLLVTATTFLLSISPAFGLSDFNGTWVLDLRASSSPEPVLKRLGVSWIERQFGSSMQMESTYTQTPKVLTVQLRGVGFRRTDVMHIDSQPEMKEDSRTGRYTIRTFWSGNGAQLISDVVFRTKDSRDAQFRIARELADSGKTLVLTGTLKIAGESKVWTLRRVWRKQGS
jgi:polyisoprenoid-binding protein YceI